MDILNEILRILEFMGKAFIHILPFFVMSVIIAAGIGIGGGLTAAALPHHRTYGSVSGGSNRLDHSTSVSGEGEEPSIGKELVRHRQLKGFHV